jgi:hypothetical protein
MPRKSAVFELKSIWSLQLFSSEKKTFIGLFQRPTLPTWTLDFDTGVRTVRMYPEHCLPFFFLIFYAFLVGYGRR